MRVFIFITLLLCTYGANWAGTWVKGTVSEDCCTFVTPVTISQSGTTIKVDLTAESSQACKNAGINGKTLNVNEDIGDATVLPLNEPQLGVEGTLTLDGNTATFASQNGCNTVFTRTGSSASHISGIVGTCISIAALLALQL